MRSSTVFASMSSTAAVEKLGLSALPRYGRVVYVVLLVLAWIQLSYAGHQFEHVAGDISDTCSVCSHFERLDHAVAADVGLPDVPVVLSRITSVLPQPSGAQCIRHYFSRAPPVV